MSVKKKLQRWEKAGLLNADAVQNILKYEKDHKGQKFTRSLFGLGAFAILIGILAIIASNWQAIPQNTKLILHILMNIGVAFMIFKTAKEGNEKRCDLWTFGLMGLTLTFIGLCGQVFHLKGDIADAFMLWGVLVTPFVVIYGRTLISLFPWIVGVLFAVYAAAQKYIFADMDDELIIVFGLAFGFFVPLAMIFASTLIQSEERITLQRVLYIGGAFLMILSASIACQLWYVDDFNTQLNALHYVGMIVISGLAIASLKFIKTPIHIIAPEDQKSLALMLMASVLATALPFFLAPVIQINFFSALAFIGYWVVIGLCAQRMDRQGLVSIAIIVIAIRIYVVYLELFGSMVMTGFGLIFSGLVLMGMAWGTRKIQKRLTQQEEV